MQHGVIYLLDGTKLAARLAVSIDSLRRFYNGPVAVLTGDESAADICRFLIEDERLSITHVPMSTAPRLGTNRGYLLKTFVNHYSPFDVSVLLDCDTLVVGAIDELFALPARDQILVTQFCNWGTACGTVHRRIRGWRAICPELIQSAVEFGRAVNTGVFAFTRETQVFPEWQRLACAGDRRFIPDEVALQLLLPAYPHVMLDERFNFSAKFGSSEVADVRVIHFHGRSHVGQCGARWIGAYQDALRRNVANLRSWTPAGDRQLRGYHRKRRETSQ